MISELTNKQEPKRVLVVDDSDLVVRLMRTFLSAEGYIVGSALDGLAGLEEFRKGSWDIVFTDREMPQMTGDRLALEIKNTDPHIPVVLVTGSGVTEVQGEVFDAIIEKPFTKAEVMACIDELLDKRNS